MMIAKARQSALLGLVAALVSYHDRPRGKPIRFERSIVRVSAPAAASETATDDQVALGARLFQDPSLSLDSTISCATCHMPNRAFAEPTPVSHGLGVRARKRNTPSLINVSVFRTSFDWDGRAATLEDQLHGVFSATGDMGIDLGEAVERVTSDPRYEAEFRRAYGRPADVAAFLAALVTFQKSLVIAESRFDRFYLGGDSSVLSQSEMRGWRLFRSGRVACGGCHVPIPDPRSSAIVVFSDNRFHNLGVGYSDGRMEDVGRYGVTRRPSDWGAFQTPSLNNVALTAPYMHDGSLATLEEVLEFYAEGGNKNPNLDRVMGSMGRRGLTKRERADLVAFLRALTTDWLSDSTAVARRLLRPYSQAGASGVDAR